MKVYCRALKVHLWKCICCMFSVVFLYVVCWLPPHAQHVSYKTIILYGDVLACYMLYNAQHTPNMMWVCYIHGYFHCFLVCYHVFMYQHMNFGMLVHMLTTT